ncbi:unnamed protein product [Nezara viridula]|uniref:Uncharacterized protein n=1 Tax=Nezara viridula TaxID=85310 RepID=A0A9P0E2H4_NEZVI|nr:unnamed protein product [Nezara viridula]
MTLRSKLQQFRKSTAWRVDCKGEGNIMSSLQQQWSSELKVRFPGDCRTTPDSPFKGFVPRFVVLPDLYDIHYGTVHICAPSVVGLCLNILVLVQRLSETTKTFPQQERKTRAATKCSSDRAIRQMCYRGSRIRVLSFRLSRALSRAIMAPEVIFRSTGAHLSHGVISRLTFSLINASVLSN